jgi:hypothetical protein
VAAKAVPAYIQPTKEEEEDAASRFLNHNHEAHKTAHYCKRNRHIKLYRRRKIKSLPGNQHHSPKT